MTKRKKTIITAGICALLLSAFALIAFTVSNPAPATGCSMQFSSSGDDCIYDSTILPARITNIAKYDSGGVDVIVDTAARKEDMPLGSYRQDRKPIYQHYSTAEFNKSGITSTLNILSVIFYSRQNNDCPDKKYKILLKKYKGEIPKWKNW